MFHSQWKPCCCGDPKQSCGCQFCAQIKAMRGPPQPWNIKYMPLSFLINIFFESMFSEDALRRPAKLPQKAFRIIAECGDLKQSYNSITSQFCTQIKAMRGPPQPGPGIFIHALSEKTYCRTQNSLKTPAESMQNNCQSNLADVSFVRKRSENACRMPAKHLQNIQRTPSEHR